MILQNRRRRSMPVLNTSSLPDLIFTVLFFFMVATHMRKVTLKVKYTVPQGTELTRLTKKSAVSYIYIGKPVGAKVSGKSAESCIQINDKYASTADIAAYMSAEKKRMSPEDRLRMTVSVKADRGTRMALINEVKMALRKANVRKISYSAEKKSDELTIK